jgi:hypothetical protein
MTLTLEERQVLDRIISARAAWISLKELALAAVERLRQRGLVVEWTSDAKGHEFQDGPYITLTPLGAAYNQVILIEQKEGCPRWGDIRKAEEREKRHSPIRTQRWAGIQLMRFPELVAIQDCHKAYMVNEDNEIVFLFNIPILIDPRLTRIKRRDLQ